MNSCLALEAKSHLEDREGDATVKAAVLDADCHHESAEEHHVDPLHVLQGRLLLQQVERGPEVSSVSNKD